MSNVNPTQMKYFVVHATKASLGLVLHYSVLFILVLLNLKRLLNMTYRTISHSLTSSVY